MLDFEIIRIIINVFFATNFLFALDSLAFGFEGKVVV